MSSHALPKYVALDTCPCCGHYWGSYFKNHCDRPAEGGGTIPGPCGWRRCSECGANVRRNGTHTNSREHAEKCDGRTKEKA